MSGLVLIRGAPGSGKSTYARKYYAGHVLREADDFFLSEGGDYIFDHTKIKQAHAECQRKTIKALGLGLDVVVANTFTKIWELEPYLDMCDDISVIHLTTAYTSIHNVPLDIVDRMRSEYEEMINEITI